jgi:hypothetical protein
MNFLHVVNLLQTHLVCSTDTAEAGYVTTSTKSAGGRRHTASLGGTENAVVIREVDGENSEKEEPSMELWRRNSAIALVSSCAASNSNRRPKQRYRASLDPWDGMGYRSNAAPPPWFSKIGLET